MICKKDGFLFFIVDNFSSIVLIVLRSVRFLTLYFTRLLENFYCGFQYFLVRLDAVHKHTNILECANTRYATMGIKHKQLKAVCDVCPLYVTFPDLNFTKHYLSAVTLVSQRTDLQITLITFQV